MTAYLKQLTKAKMCQGSMDKLIFKVTMAFLVLALSLACDRAENVEPVGQISPIVATDLPEHGSVGEEISFTVSHIVFNGCGYFSSQKTHRTGNIFIVTYYAQYRDGICTMNIPTLKTNYIFTPSKAGIYTFKFNGGDNGYLIQTIVVD